jgi:beta-mannosidase
MAKRYECDPRAFNVITLDNWFFTSVDAGKYSGPSELPTDISFSPAIVPGTVAQSLGASIGENLNLDKLDWWYSCKFEVAELKVGSFAELNFAGLATLAEVWLNDELILSSKNMFIGYLCDITSILKTKNKLDIRFRSLDQELLIKKARPRWKTALVAQQNLRFIRTTLLGRMPGWSPLIQPIGPWKSVSVYIQEKISISTPVLQTTVLGTSGIVCIEADILCFSDVVISKANLIIKEKAYPLKIENNKIKGNVEVKNIELWWPHTHGDPVLYSVNIEIESSIGKKNIDCGRIGFKSILLCRANGQVRFFVNDVQVFMRGACWTVNDFISLVGTEKELKSSLTFAKECGLNMFRIGGTMIYESDEFYKLCDEYGILVWQDFMFANMDYPVLDPDFKKEIEYEANYQLARLSKHPSLAVYCGGSEVQQQAAMMGLPKNMWSNEFFENTLPSLINQLHKDIPYFPSSPCEGALPFHVGEGITHYYGVGAYKRDFTDVKHAKVKFASECLGISNIPENETLQILGNGNLPMPHSPIWKSRVPRDFGSGYDFEDIRDFYLNKLFNLDPVELRNQNVPRYFELSRVTSGEVMKRVYSEWRSPENICGGGLIWFYKDLAPGAGWGIIDSLGRRKAAWYDLRKVWSSQVVLMTDEGLDGLKIHILNESQNELSGVLELEFFSFQKNRLVHVLKDVCIGARASLSFQSDELVGYFTDVTNSYRFGPAKYDVIRASLKKSDGKMISEDFYFPNGMNLPSHDCNCVQMTADYLNADEVELTIKSNLFLQNVYLSAVGFTSEDNYFHLAPNVVKKIILKINDNKSPIQFKLDLTAINLRDSVTVRAIYVEKVGDLG